VDTACDHVAFFTTAGGAESYEVYYPSNPLSSNTYLESTWSDGAGNGSAAGRTQRETTSPGRTLPQPPLAIQEYDAATCR
jgi:hypothetical protein